MKEFIFANWQWIVAFVFAAIEFIILLCRKQVKTDTLKEKILQLLPSCISLAEEILGSGNGEKKKDLASRMIKALLSAGSDYDDFISSAIESILSTPTKK